MKRKILSAFQRFQVKVTAVIILSILFVLIVSNFLIYKFSFDAQFEALRGRLKVIAQTAALLVEPDELLAVPLQKDGIYTTEFNSVLGILRKMKTANPMIKYLYTMRKTDKPGIWQFVVDVDTIPENVDAGRKPKSGPYAFPGDQYDASRFAEMMKAFDGPAADTKIEVDHRWGATLSGYAPIRNAAGEAVAILGVDMGAEDIYAIRQESQQRILGISIFAVVLAFFLGVVIARPITRPVKILVDGTRRIGKGNLLYRVPVKGEDEISELGRAFNHMAQSLYKSRRRLLGYFYNVVKMLVRVLEARDHYTRGHSESVARYAGEIALRMGIPKEDVKVFKKMTILHDIGKIGIRDQILNKPDELTPEEWERIKQHPVIGEKILKPVLDDQNMLAVVRSHHERYDGNGYPDRLKGEDINIFAAIVTVADSFHAMISDRPYRKAMSKDEAVVELKKHRGTQFHPKVVDIFLQILEGQG